MADLMRLFNSKNHSSDMDLNDILEHRFVAMLSYFSWLVLIPIFTARDSKFARFHANQGLVLAVVEIIAYFVITKISVFGVATLHFRIGILGILLAGLVGLICFVLSIMGAVNAVKGRAKELPLIGSLRIIQ